MVNLLRILLELVFGHRFTPREENVRNENELSDTADQLEIARTAHDEARTVLDHQINILDDTDHKAARTVRITVLLLGAILGITTLGDPDGIPLGGPFVLWGSINIVLSIVLGMITYNVSQPYLGISGAEVDQLLHETECELDMLHFLLQDGYKNWISETGYINWKNSLYFDLTQTSLAVGLVYLTLGALHGVGTPTKIPELYPILNWFLETRILWLPTAGIVSGTTAVMAHSLYRRVLQARND